MEDQALPWKVSEEQELNSKRHKGCLKMEVLMEERVCPHNNALDWGKSLPVPSVQEMVRKDFLGVPERYIQELENRPRPGVLHASSEIPIIDFSMLANGDRDESNKLDFACQEWGFFQIINHGVKEHVLQKMIAAETAFFDLPLEEKKKYAIPENDFQGYGQAFVVSDQQKLDWNDLMILVTRPSEYRNMKYWPTTITGFEEAVDEFSREIERVSEEILSSLSVLMGMEKNGLKEVHGRRRSAIRMNYYPCCSKPDLVLGISPHSDSSTITLLRQDDHLTGLQIKHGGDWVPVNPIPNALVVNIGDLIQVWSNGKYKSVEHRAVTNAMTTRKSAATFVFPEDKAEIEPLEPMLLENPRIYRKFKFRDFAKHRVSSKLDGKNHLDFLRFEENN